MIALRRENLIQLPLATDVSLSQLRDRHLCVEVWPVVLILHVHRNSTFRW